MKAFLIFVSIGLVPMAANAQFSFNLLGGVANYQGDLAKDLTTVKETHVAFGGGLGYKISPYVDIKAQILLTTLSGDDTNHPERISNQRAFKFESNITELSLVLDYNIFGSSERSSTGVFSPSFTPLVYGGIGLLKVNNTAECFSSDCINGVILSPFPEIDAKSTLISIPFGIGLKYDVSPLMAVGLRGGYRYSFSDYIDGVSKAANADANDWYFVLGANVVFYIQKRNKGGF